MGRVTVRVRFTVKGSISVRARVNVSVRFALWGIGYARVRHRVRIG